MLSADGLARLVIPAGALAAATSIRVLPDPALPLDGRVLKGSGYRIDPVTVAFTTAATLTITYQPANRPRGSEESDLKAGFITTVGEAAPIVPSTVDVTAHTVTTTTLGGGAGSYYALWGGFAQPCTSPESQQFDFWIGNWNYAAPNAFPGTDDVTKDPTGCAIIESFVDRSNTRGRSVSFYNAATQRWYQTFVDTQGGRLEFEGVVVNGTMVLNDSPTSRWLWIPVDANHVQQRVEQTSDGGATWHAGGTATYTRR